MSVQALVGRLDPDSSREHGVLTCNTTDVAFGPLTSDADVPDGDLYAALGRLLLWVKARTGKDPRALNDGDLVSQHSSWLTCEQKACCEHTRIQAIESAAQHASLEYARDLAGHFGLEVDDDGKLVNEDDPDDVEGASHPLDRIGAAEKLDPTGPFEGAVELWRWANEEGANVYVAKRVSPTRNEWGVFLRKSMDPTGLLVLATSGPGHDHWDYKEALLWSYVMAAKVRPDGTFRKPEGVADGS